MGSAQCTVYAPNSFTLDAELKARVLDPSADPPDVLRHAVRACPTGALNFDSDEQEERA